MKTRLAEAIIAAHFAEPRERRAEWVAHPARVAEVRAAAAERARRAARIVLDRARAACGVACGRLRDGSGRGPRPTAEIAHPPSLTSWRLGRGLRREGGWPRPP